MKTTFVHIPKTAGTSIKSSIDSHCNYTFPYGHDPYFILQQNNDLSDSYTFTVVRNPFTRTVSYYLHFCTQNQIDDTSFEDFLYLLKEGYSTRNTPMMPYPQSFYVHDLDGNIPENLKIFRFERLKELEKTLKIKLNKLNSSNYSRGFYHSCYTPKNIERVCELFSCDFINFNYSFDFTYE